MPCPLSAGWALVKRDGGGKDAPEKREWTKIVSGDFFVRFAKTRFFLAKKN